MIYEDYMKELNERGGAKGEINYLGAKKGKSNLKQ